MNNDEQGDPYMSPEARSSRRIFIGIIILFALAGILMYSEHRVHVLGLGLWLLLLACPLLHIFMHGGHGGHGSHSDHAAHTKKRLDQGNGDQKAPRRSEGEEG